MQQPAEQEAHRRILAFTTSHTFLHSQRTEPYSVYYSNRSVIERWIQQLYGVYIVYQKCI